MDISAALTETVWWAQAVIQKFPEDVLARKDRASVFFVTLVARLVSDPSPKCRALVGHTLKALILVSHPSLTSLTLYRGLRVWLMITLPSITLCQMLLVPWNGLESFWHWDIRKPRSDAPGSLNWDQN